MSEIHETRVRVTVRVRVWVRVRVRVWIVSRVRVRVRVRDGQVLNKPLLTSSGDDPLQALAFDSVPCCLLSLKGALSIHPQISRRNPCISS